MANCTACGVLQLPSVADMDGESSVSRIVQFECSRIIPHCGSLLSMQDEGITPPDNVWNSYSGTGFCTLVLATMARKYSQTKQSAIRELTRNTAANSAKQTLVLLLRLSTPSFKPYIGNRDVDGAVLPYKGIPMTVLSGTLDMTLDDDADGLTKQRIDIALPFEIFSSRDEIVDPGSGVYRRQLASDALSDENVKLVKDWLDNCAGTHFRCASLPEGVDKTRVYRTQSEESVFLPTRLVYLCNPLKGEDPT
jgi:hypothetical protein